MIEPSSFLTAFLLGLFGSSHCIVMCGGIGAAIAVRRGPQSAVLVSDQATRIQQYCTPRFEQRLSNILLFNLGRIASYGVIGAIVGGLGLLLAEAHQSLLLILRVIAGVLLIGMGFYIARWSLWLTHLEQLGQAFWRQYLQPYSSQLLKAPSITNTLLLGGLWGWLPCGLIYSTLVWAGTASSPINSGLLMLMFGLGTLPSMIAVGLSASFILPLLKSTSVRNITGMLLVLYGLWTIFIAAMGSLIQHHPV